MSTAAVHVDGKKICDGLIAGGVAVAEVRAVAEALGASVGFAAAPNVVLIKSPVPQPESWEQLAERMGLLAAMDGQEIALLQATVEAETGGDNRLLEWDGEDTVGGVGYGQVWPRWHSQTVTVAAAMLHLPLPVPMQTETGLQVALYSNREISMLTVALLVRDWWREANGDFDAFTRRYVGAGVSDEDLHRRQLIWERRKMGRILPR